MKHLFSSFAATALICAQLQAQSITDSTLQTNTQQQLTFTPSNPAELTAANWDFTGQTIPMSIGFISITLTLQDGNSAAGDFDFDHLFLALDGVNTGLRLNGFRGGGLEDTLTISGSITPAISAQLITALADSMLAGTIITDNPMDTALTPNDIFVGNDAGNAQTTLTLAVPEPGTVALIGLGLLLAIAPRVRRLRGSR